jgi:hypothetical protein
MGRQDCRELLIVYVYNVRLTNVLLLHMHSVVYRLGRAPVCASSQADCTAWKTSKAATGSLSVYSIAALIPAKFPSVHLTWVHHRTPRWCPSLFCARHSSHPVPSVYANVP